MVLKDRNEIKRPSLGKFAVFVFLLKIAGTFSILSEIDMRKLAKK